MARWIGISVCVAIAVALSLLCSFVLTAWFFLAVFALWAATKLWGDGVGRKPAVLFLLLVFVCVPPLWVRHEPRPTSIAEDALPFQYFPGVTVDKGVMARANLAPKLDELAASKESLGRAINKLRAQADIVERAIDLEIIADGLSAYARVTAQPLDPVVNAKRDVVQSLKAHKIDSAAALQAKKQSMNTFLNGYERQLKELNDAASAKKAFTDFELQLPDNSVDDLNDAVIKLESAVMQLGKTLISKDVQVSTLLSATVDEHDRTIARDTVITLDATQLPMQSIDASELLATADPSAISNKILVALGKDESNASEPSNPAAIPLRNGTRQVKLILRSVAKLDLVAISVPYRPALDFKSFKVRWGAPQASRLRVMLDLSKMSGPDRYPYVFDVPSDPAIESLRVPADSVFAASYSFKPARRVDDIDVLESNGDLKPTWFSSHDYLYVELLPDSALFRNSVVQDHKTLLFVENLAMTLLLALVALLVAILLP